MNRSCNSKKDLFLEGEVVAGGVLYPRVVLRALHAGVQADGLAGQLPGGQGAGVGQRAEGLSLDVALLLPGGEVPDGGELRGGLHPLQDLSHGHEVDVVLAEDLVHPLHQGVQVVLVETEPARVEVQAWEKGRERFD